jgi:hypothetical protein
MRIEDLTEDEASLVLSAFHAARDGPFFPDWEFQTLMGFDRSDLGRLIDEWPRPADPDALDRAVNNVLNMLLGYPHHKWESWRDFSPASPRDLAVLLTKWRGDSTFDSTPRGTFDRWR